MTSAAAFAQLLVFAVLSATFICLSTLLPTYLIPISFALILLPLLASPTWRLTGLLFAIAVNNLVLSSCLAFVDISQAFPLLQGTSYMFILGAAAFSAYEIAPHHKRPDLPGKLILLWLAICFAYLLLGFIKGASPSAAVGNFRNFTIGPLAFLSGYAIGNVLTLRQSAISVKAVLITVIIAGLCEMLMTDWWYDLISYPDYMYFKRLDTPRASALELQDYFTRTLFNLSFFQQFELRALRLSGPHLHAISYGYTVGLLTLFCLSQRYTWPLIFALPLLFMIGAKGPLILLTIALVFFAGQRLPINFPTLVRLFWVTTLAYVTAAFIIGYKTADYHVIGFLGGLKGFLANPLGHGLGKGGNFGNLSQSQQWDDFQRYGADVGLESAIGVLLYQIGAAAIALLPIYKNIITRLLTASISNSTKTLVAFPLILIFANAIFQEEAFAPAALGTASLFAGLAIAANNRKEVPTTA